MHDRTPTVRVFGPAYLDRVLRVDGPLHRPGIDRPIDRSVAARRSEAIPEVARALILRGSDRSIEVDPLPADWPGPWGTIDLDALELPADRRVGSLGWRDDLGGMGAGYAAALGGRLTCPLGSADDPITRRILGLLDRYGVSAVPTQAPGVGSDWTLLLSSGPHGDKLPIGFRSCLPVAADFPGGSDAADLLVVAGLSNRLARSAVASGPATLRLLAPAIRNMRDGDPPLGAVAVGCQVLTCNAEEWSALDDREAVAARLDLLIVTEGPRGARFRYRDPDENPVETLIPAFPRSDPPRDTNRAGEAFASTAVIALWKAGWRGGPLSDSLASSVGRRASAAAALVIDRTDFDFPTASEIDRALERGRVEAAPRPG